MKPITEITINRLPVRTWNWLGMNESVIKGEEARFLQEAERAKPESLQAGYEESLHVGREEIQRAGQEEKVYRFMCADGESKMQEIELLAEMESRLTVWMEISSAKVAEGLFSLNTEITARENAKVRLIQVQLLGESYRFLNDINIECEKGAEVEILQLFLGGVKIWSSLTGNLNGADSKLSVELGYWGRKNQRLDMNYVALHKAKTTMSQIHVKGVLADEAFKLFRGTIDFKQGASDSEGEETEDVLMLGEDAVNQTIPLILCEEEDVQGNHGATIGTPDEEVLFYLGSRGIKKEDAVTLLARAKIDALSAWIENAEIEEQVQNYLEEVTGHGRQQVF